MKPRVVISHWVNDEVLSYLNDSCIPVPNHSKKTLPREELIERAKDAEGLMVFMPDCIDNDFLNACPKLTIIAAALKGYDNFDIDACSQHGIWFTIVPDLLSVPTAELTVGLMISLGRNFLPGDRDIRARQFRGWRPTLYGAGLSDATVGILGMGAVGSEVAKRLQGFDANVVYFDKVGLTAAKETELKVQRRPLWELLAMSDFIVNILPLSEDTYHLVSKKTIALMKTGAYLINTGRGSVVDEEAVADALEQGKLRGYAADVFEFEDWALAQRPQSIAQKLINDQARTLFTPHLGSAVDDARKDIALSAAQNIVQVLQGEIPQNAVNQPLQKVKALAQG